MKGNNYRRRFLPNKTAEKMNYKTNESRKKYLYKETRTHEPGLETRCGGGGDPEKKTKVR